MNAASKKRLSLKTETLHALANAELVRVQGAGFTDISGSCSCNSCICSYFGRCETKGCP